MAVADDAPVTHRRVRRRRRSPLFTLLVIVIIVVALVLVGMLLLIETAEAPGPMLGPGTFPDASNRVDLVVPLGWELVHDTGETRIVRVDGTLPSYQIALKTDVQMNMVLNWDCNTLLERIDQVVPGITPWDATITYVSVPCAEDETRPAYAHVYLALNDGSGQNALLVFGPAGGGNWIVAEAGPFEGDAPPDLVEAMTRTVTTVRARAS